MHQFNLRHLRSTRNHHTIIDTIIDTATATTTTTIIDTTIIEGDKISIIKRDNYNEPATYPMYTGDPSPSPTSAPIPTSNPSPHPLYSPHCPPKNTSDTSAKSHGSGITYIEDDVPPHRLRRHWDFWNLKRRIIWVYRIV